MELARDMRYLCRSLVRSPGYTATVLIALALGIGANVTLFLLVNAVLFRPLPYSHDKSLAMMWSPPRTAKAEAQWLVVSYPDFLDWQKRSTSFAGLAAYNISSGDLTSGDVPESIAGAVVTNNFFSILGVQPLLGNGFDKIAADEQVIVLSHALWQRRFQGAASVLGSKLLLSGHPYTVIGILPPTFEQPEPFWDRRAEFWLPLPANFSRMSRNDRLLRVVGRLRDGVSIQSAQGEMLGIGSQLEREFPQSNRNRTIRVLSLRDQLFGDLYRPLLLLLASSLAVLLIACANVTNLQLARTTSRGHEMVIRSALGASPFRLLFWSYGESLLLASCGAAGGILFALVTVRILLSIGSKSFPMLHRVGMDLRAFLFVFGSVFVVAALTALIPTARMLTYKLGAVLSLNNRSQQGGVVWRRIRGLLVSGQLALVLPLLILSVMLSRSFYNLAHVDPGFNSQNLLTFRLSLPQNTYPDLDQVRIFFSELTIQLQSAPGVQSVAITSGLPLTVLNTQYLRGFTMETDAERGTPRSAYYRVVNEDYFHTLNIPIVSGRAFTASDGIQGQTAALVNETFAQNYWHGQDPIGRRIRIDGVQTNGGWVAVVGVVGNVHYNGLSISPASEIYVPFAQDPWRSMAIAVRTGPSPASVLPSARDAVRQKNALLPLGNVQTMEDIVSNATAQSRFAALVITISAGLAFVLALVGVSGVVAYLVTERTREFGVRLALGAQARDVIRLVLIYGLKLALVGSVVGIVLAALTTRLFGHLVYGVTVLDFISFSGATLLLLSAALAACYIPARRIVEISPASSLRVD